MKKIQKQLQQYMADPYRYIVSHGEFKVLDFYNLNKVINNTEEDFLIFENGGGKKFEILFDRRFNKDGMNQIHKVKDFIKHLLKEKKHWIFAYQINRKQVVLRKLSNG